MSAYLVLLSVLPAHPTPGSHLAGVGPEEVSLAPLVGLSHRLIVDVLGQVGKNINKPAKRKINLIN